VTWVDFAAVNQTTPLWIKMPAVMVRKCVRVAGLRATYPEAFGGLYVAGERPDDVETGEETEVSAPPVMEKPALPAPRPAEVLTFSTEREKVPVQRADGAGDSARPMQEEREPGSDDDEPDRFENEANAIVFACESVSTPEAFAELAARGKRLLAGSESRKRAAAALERAHKRMNATPAQGAA
jgi:hypothetical protein